MMKDLFYEILQEISMNMDKIRSCNLADEEAERKLFADVLAPSIIMIEELREDFLLHENLDLELYDIDVHNYGLEIVALCVLSKDIQLWEIFDDPEAFVDVLCEVPGMQLVVNELLDDTLEFSENVTLKNLQELL